jgi:hypothetical protein
MLENVKLKRVFGDTGKKKIRDGIKLHITEFHKSNFR